MSGKEEIAAITVSPCTSAVLSQASSSVLLPQFCTTGMHVIVGRDSVHEAFLKPADQGSAFNRLASGTQLYQCVLEPAVQ